MGNRVMSSDDWYQSVLDPLQTTFDTVDSLGLAGKVTMQVRHRDLEGRQASPHVAHVRAQLAHLQPKDAQMLEDEGAGLIGHDPLLLCLYCHPVNLSSVANSRILPAAFLVAYIRVRIS
jgi:hypothetical protein